MYMYTCVPYYYIRPVVGRPRRCLRPGSLSLSLSVYIYIYICNKMKKEVIISSSCYLMNML